MSYSRWSNGSWYVFWDSMYSGDTKDSQALACWYSLDDGDKPSWTYDEIDKLLKKSFDQIIHTLQIKYDCSPDEANELQEYMQEWRNDVNNQFSA